MFNASSWDAGFAITSSWKAGFLRKIRSETSSGRGVTAARDVPIVEAPVQVRSPGPQASGVAAAQWFPSPPAGVRFPPGLPISCHKENSHSDEGKESSHLIVNQVLGGASPLIAATFPRRLIGRTPGSGPGDVGSTPAVGAKLIQEAGYTRDMRDEYRIEKVEPVGGNTDVELMIPSAIYTLKRREDRAVFRVRLPLDERWCVGELVRIEPFHIQAAIVS